ncbi:MAG: hypothetical protein NC191_06925, partial [Muribaculaceae bacterium]|nr:hypothetical protein [Muribaculaceae bacterium]
WEPSDVEEELSEFIRAYLPTTESVVSYFRILEFLFQCSGVEDVTEFTLNGGQVSIDISDTEYPVLGEVSIVA